MVKLGVNVDHVATLRQARHAQYPDPLEAALLALRSGADAITVHLREDRRHIQDQDLFRLAAARVRLNQELAPIDEMVDLALRVRPAEVCFVPERRQELTTEGGLDAVGLARRLRPFIRRLRDARIGVSLFIEPESEQIDMAGELGANFIELHTGRYAELADRDLAGQRGKSAAQALHEQARAELEKIRVAARAARAGGLKVNAGHGLNYLNTPPIAAIPGLQWLHIGHSIISRAVTVGLARAVREMKTLIAASAGSRPGALARRSSTR